VCERARGATNTNVEYSKDINACVLLRMEVVLGFLGRQSESSV
jgi:hypothetical protein